MQNIAICVREVNAIFHGDDKTRLEDPAFSFGLWVYGMTCSKQSQRWLAANTWKNVPSSYADYCVFVNPLFVVPSASRSRYAANIIEPYLSLYRILLSSPEHMDVPFENWCDLFTNISDARCLRFFQDTVPHLQHVVKKISNNRETIAAGGNVDADVLHTLCSAFEKLCHSFQKCKRCALSHASAKVVCRDDLLTELMGNCSYKDFAAVQACDSDLVCVKMYEKNKTKSFLYLDIKHTLQTVWPIYAKNVKKNTVLLENTQPDVAYVLMSKNLYELLQNLYFLEIAATSDLKEKISANSLCGENIKRELKKVATENKTTCSSQKQTMFVFQRNPFTHNFDLAEKTQTLWSPDFMFLQKVVARLYDGILYKQQSKQEKHNAAR